jgi:hypothetical protein
VGRAGQQESEAKVTLNRATDWAQSPVFKQQEKRIEELEREVLRLQAPISVKDLVADLTKAEREVERLRGLISAWVMADGVPHSYCSCGHCHALQVADNERKP